MDMRIIIVFISRALFGSTITDKTWIVFINRPFKLHVMIDFKDNSLLIS